MKKIEVKTLLRLGCCCGLLFCVLGLEGMNVNASKPNQSNVNEKEVTNALFAAIKA